MVSRRADRRYRHAGNPLTLRFRRIILCDQRSVPAVQTCLDVALGQIC